MASVRELQATARPGSGKGAARAVRREGLVPGIIYGANQPPQSIELDSEILRQRILGGRFLTSIFDIEIEGKKQRVIPRDYQLDPLRDRPLHVDFMRLGEGAMIRVRVPVRLHSAEQSPGIKRGGTANIVAHAIELQCPAESIPEAIDVDLTGLEINHSKHLSDIALPPNVHVIGQASQTLVTIVPPSGYAEEMKAASEAAAAAAAPAAGAAAPAGGAAAGAAAGDKKAGGGAGDKK
jgi:large subunit ribosomal protein L25